MSGKVEDLNLVVKLDLESAGRGADQLDRRARDREQRRERDRERRSEEKKQRGRFLPGARGIGTDLARGRVPGLNRLGGAAAKVAGLIGVIELIDMAAGAGSGLPLIGGPLGEISKRIKLGKSALTAGFSALEETKDYALSRRLAGSPAGVDDAGAFFSKRREIAQELGKAEVFRELLTAPELGPSVVAAIGGALKTLLLDPFLELFRSDERVQGEVRKVVREEVDNRLRGAQGWR